MLDKSAFLQANRISESKTIFIKAWGNEVRIRPLSIAENVEVLSTLGALNGTELSKEAPNAKKLIDAQLLCAHYALVEPTFSLDELKNLSASAFGGIAEIFGAVNEMANEKKDLS